MQKKAGLPAALSVKPISVCKTTLLRGNRWRVFQIMWYYSTWTWVFLQLSIGQCHHLKRKITSTCMTAPSFIMLGQLYLCYGSFTHVISVYVALSLEATSSCGTCVASLASILVFCGAGEPIFTHSVLSTVQRNSRGPFCDRVIEILFHLLILSHLKLVL